MIVISLLGLGIIAWIRIPLEFAPKLDFPYLGVYVPYAGATPEQVENEIAIPAEGEFRTLSNLQRIVTNSDGNGCWVGMMFDWGTDMSAAASDVRDRMERLKLELPQDVDRLYLRRWSMNAMPVLAVGLFSDEDSSDFANKVQTLLEARLMRIDGVAEVAIFGSRPEKEVLIEFDQNALRSLNLSLYELVSMLQSSNLNFSVGELTEGPTKYLVRISNELRRPEEIAQLPLGNGLRIEDVAKVGYREREQDWYYAIESQGGAFVVVRKESEANTVDVCRAVRKELDAVMASPEFEGAEKFVFFDQSTMIVSSLSALLDAGRYGGLMALIVLFLFLRRFRPTTVVAFTIPASLVVAVIVMFFSGMTLNIGTMTSLIIGVGMLVDNSIVVIENIYRYRQLGYNPVDAARRGASEVGLAITAATATTVVVFVPVFYLEGGEMSVYMRQFAVPVGVALFSSLVLALTVIPLAASRMKERHELWIVQRFQALRSRLLRQRVRNGESGAGRAGLWDRLRNTHPIQKSMDAYIRFLGLAMRWRVAALLVLVGVVVLTAVVPFRRVSVNKLPELDKRYVVLDVTLEQNFDITMAREVFLQLQDLIDQQRGELGVKNVFLRCRPWGGTIEVYLDKPEDLKPGQEIRYTTRQVADILAQRISRRLPGGEIEYTAEVGDSQTQSEDKGGISLRLRGDDRKILMDYAERFKELLAQVPNVSDVTTDIEQDSEEIQLAVDEDLAARAGISPLTIARTVDFALRGARLPYIKQGGKEVQVWAQFREEDRKSKANLENVTVLGATGRLVPLNELVSTAKDRTAATIRREDGKNVITISAKTGGDDFRGILRNVDRLIGSFNLPRGYSIARGEEMEELAKTLANMVTALLLSVILVFIVMGALFESLLLPLSILTTIPLAFIGVYWTLYLTGTPIDTIAYIGFILMVGVVVNNGIVIVDHINYLRRQTGLGRHEAILQAGRDRFRPVMMTALTTILGALPLALGGGVGSAVSFSSLGRTLMGGLGAGTILTLIVVPLFYTFVDDFQQWAMHFLANILSLGRHFAPSTGKKALD